jgi:hypothetical protein
VLSQKWELKKGDLSHGKEYTTWQKDILPDDGKIGNRFVREMCYGILKRGDVKTTNNSGGDYSKMIEHAMMTSYHRSFDENTVVAIDHSDLKLYAHKMEKLPIVHDGDRGTFGNGYNHEAKCIGYYWKTFLFSFIKLSKPFTEEILHATN